MERGEKAARRVVETSTAVVQKATWNANRKVWELLLKDGIVIEISNPPEPGK